MIKAGDLDLGAELQANVVRMRMQSALVAKEKADTRFKWLRRAGLATPLVIGIPLGIYLLFLFLPVLAIFLCIAVVVILLVIFLYRFC